jgi:hypothetical protein
MKYNDLAVSGHLNIAFDRKPVIDRSTSSAQGILNDALVSVM